MIKHSIKEDIIYVSIDKMDFNYRIPIKKIGSTVDWKIGEKETKGIVVKNVSTWTVHLFTTKTLEDKYIEQFKIIVQENSANNKIDWDSTFLAINIQNEYNWMVETNKKVAKKISEEEIVLNLKKKYKID
ncbi:MAG: hypothetical protein KJ941_03730 [Bacteroidetes bacterium]|nr:hypothetical protein [Bacteroidota bacterium]